MKPRVLFFGIALVLFSSSLSGVGAEYEEKDLYTRIYNEMNYGPHDLALAEMEKKYGTPVGVFERALENPTKIRLNALPFGECVKIISSEAYSRCFGRLITEFEQEKEIALTKIRTKSSTSAASRWADGTLENSSFDIVVNLNMIDVILFGPNATIPSARTPETDGFRARRYGDIVDSLDPRIGEDDVNDSVSGQDSTGDSAGGDSNAGSDNDPVDDDGDGGSSSDLSDPALMCRDPDALFFGNMGGSTNDMDTSDDGGNTGGNDSGDSSSSDSGDEGDGDSSDDTGDDSDSSDSDESDADVSPDADDGEVCEGKQVPLFHGMVCVPEFCEDLICVFTQITPGQAFSFASAETPACIECMIERGYELLTTLEKFEISPQDGTPGRFKMRVQALLRDQLGNSTPRFRAIPKSLPGYPSSPEQKHSESEVVIKGFGDVSVPVEFSKENTVSEDEGEQEPFFSNPNNADLARLILRDDCSTLGDLFPEETEMTHEEMLEFCREHRMDDEDLILSILGNENEITSIADRRSTREREDEFAREVLGMLQRFEGSMAEFTNEVAQFTTQDIDAVNITCQVR